MALLIALLTIVGLHDHEDYEDREANSRQVRDPLEVDGNRCQNLLLVR